MTPFPVCIYFMRPPNQIEKPIRRKTQRQLESTTTVRRQRRVLVIMTASALHIKHTKHAERSNMPVPAPSLTCHSETEFEFEFNANNIVEIGIVVREVNTYYL